MRTWGRVYSDPDTWTWVEVSTDDQGFNDYVYITTLVQTLLLNLGESPFYADYGIPAQPAVIQQIFPDFYVAMTQQQFAPFFAALTVAKVDAAYPSYRINITTQQGVRVNAEVPIPT